MSKAFRASDVAAMLVEVDAFSSEEEALAYVHDFADFKRVGFDPVVTIDMKFPPEPNHTARRLVLRELRNLVRDGVVLDEARLNQMVLEAKGVVNPFPDLDKEAP